MKQGAVQSIKMLGAVPVSYHDYTQRMTSSV